MSSYWSNKSRPYRSTFAAGRVASSPSSAPPTPPPPFGPILQTVRIDELFDASKNFASSATIRDVQVVTSYNWVDRKGTQPTILVPGKPPLWTPPSPAPQLRQDDGAYFRDKNAARYPKHPIEPGVVACLDADPDLPAKVDIMACSSTLGNLLRFVRGSGEDKPFRMLVEKVGNTVFLVRRENSPTELIPDVRGYGHAFPEAYTTWEPEVKGSGSHQRLLRYSFGGLDFVIRFGADGYIKPAGKPAPSQPSTEREKGPSVDDLIETMSSAAVVPRKAPAAGALKVETAGSPVDQKNVFDLKTRSIFTKEKKDHLADELPRLWVAQIPFFILAFHKSGYFAPSEIQIRDVREDVRVWEKNQAANLARLAALLHRIVDIVSSTPSLKVELRCCEVGKLEIREKLAEAGDILSSVVRARWETVCDAGVDSYDEKDYDLDSDREDRLSWDEGSEKDFTACSADDCGYCGHCPY
ncbi:hypothetical protein QBC34DRAFT_351756 [Podospora aff. communis PSN243]|uniref:Geranylgeranyl pyrophosphate synthetase n=1 Tax=Podospora aff. communis PSN243 TaxID=3040156 RepID=A0AAV9GQV6_9PEZI|nr:hypothetical protein QBC34DRAFT_351756 [Podospora aff. communis PSN243]